MIFLLGIVIACGLIALVFVAALIVRAFRGRL